MKPRRSLVLIVRTTNHLVSSFINSPKINGRNPGINDFLLILSMSFLLSSCYGSGMAVAPAIAATVGKMVASSKVGEEVGESLADSKEDQVFDTEFSQELLDRKVTVLSDYNLTIVVHAIIEPNGSDSWVVDAPWDEIVFTVKNIGQGDVAVKEIKAIDVRGVYIDQLGSDAPIFFAQKRLFEANKPSTSSYTTAVVEGAVTQGLGAVTGFSPGISMGYMSGKVAMQTASFNKLTEENEKISKEFQRRQVTKLMLAPNGSITGCAFFPNGEYELRELVFFLENGQKLELLLQSS